MLGFCGHSDEFSKIEDCARSLSFMCECFGPVVGFWKKITFCQQRKNNQQFATSCFVNSWSQVVRWLSANFFMLSSFQPPKPRNLLLSCGKIWTVYAANLHSFFISEQVTLLDCAGFMKHCHTILINNINYCPLATAVQHCIVHHDDLECACCSVSWFLLYM